MATTSIPASEAIPFKQILIDQNPGTTPVVKLLVDIDNNGKEDAVIGHENNLGGGGLDLYEFPTSGNPSAKWNEISIDPKADVYESIRAADISGNVDSHGNPVNDLVVNEAGTVYWYENPLGLGENPYTATWSKHLIGSISQGVTHEMYLADLTGNGKLDVIDNTSIFFQQSPTDWVQIPTADYNRTEKGLYLFNSGSGLGDIDLLGTGNGPNFQVGWYENPRDYGGNAMTNQWIFHPIGPAYGDYVSGDGVSYAAMDVNGDGKEDIITCDGENGSGPPYLTGGLIWWQAPSNDITGTWIPHTIDSTITDVHNLVLADMDNDGQTDILAFEQDQSPQGRLMIIYNEGGTGQNWLEQTLVSDSDPATGGGEGGHNESVGDASGDGYLDILTSPHGFYTQVNPISLYFNELPSEGIVEPTVTNSPLSQNVSAGAPVTFSVAATGTGPLAYQWELNGLNIPGATSSTYTIPSVPSSDDGNVYRCIVGNPAGLIPSGNATLTVNGASQLTGSLVGSQATAASGYNLTTLGTSDWAHWGRNGVYGNFDDDATGGSQISNVTALGAGMVGGYTASSRSVSWTNGTPTASDSGDDGYIWANTALGAGFSFTVPADTTTRTLYVYAGGYSSGATLTAQLSDGSANEYTATASGSGTYTNLYTITYTAANAGQTLTITYVKSSNIGDDGGSVDLIAAALAGATVADTTPPTAAVGSTPPLTATSSSPYQFTVVYTDNVAVSASTLGNGDLLVTGPDTYSQAATLVSTGLVNGPTITATYSVPPPSGGWSNSSDGTYTIALEASQVADTSGNFALPVSKLGTFSVAIPAPGLGSLAGSQATAAASYNLTTLGTSDWAHWGTGEVFTAFDHKATGGSQISNVTELGSGNYGQSHNASRDVSWTDGTPLASDSGDDAYIFANSALGAGYSFTVPASTTTQTLYVYAGGYSDEMTLTAQLSDSSASPYVATASGSGLYTDLFTITFHAASAAQTLTISCVNTADVNGVNGAVELIAAALAGPPVADTTPPTAAVSSAPALVTAGSSPYQFTVVYTDNVAVNASTLGNNDLLVTGPNGYSQAATLVSTGLSNGPTITATYSVPPPAGSWSTSSNGSYAIALEASQVADTSGNFAAAVASLGAFSVNIAAPGLGSLVGSQATAAASYNLTTLGTSDWAHWGTGNVASAFDHKATGNSQISNVTKLGSGSYGSWYDPSRDVAWTDGTPLASDSDNAYIWANNAIGAGYSFTVPASTTTQTLYVYAGGYSSGGQLTAHLSDGSAADYVATASGSGLYTNLYTITFQAASAGQTLTISYVKTTNINGASGSVDLIAAALVVG